MPPSEKPPNISITPQESGRVVLRLGIVAFVIYLLFQIDFLAITACSLLGVYWSSSLLARSSLSGLRINISTKQLRTRCNEPIDARLRLKNENKILPIYYPTVSLREKETRRTQAFQFRGIVLPRQEVTLSVDPSLNLRGLRYLEATSPRSHFPFALHLARSNARSKSAEIIVWPRSEPLDVDSLLNDPPRYRFETSGELTFHSKTIEASRIRDYQAGDPKPSINWKLSAKRDKLTIIEPRDERQERYELHLELSKELWPTELAFERMLRQVTALVSELSRRKLTQGITLDHVHYPLTNNRELIRFYDSLATARPGSQAVDVPAPPRRFHLWILPAPNSGILLAPQTAPKFERKAIR
ncbi:DUF58 domain-containing protein [Pelagicoccus sp. SDUM812002]|uniref:DUF58 domain-containing protein n=1 Tax=Pelagicoccus sp. SDUM812002 TaxID=3041266 RepID=UPI00280FD1AB|nr:DUF58 domain-containing protein [Pelagicoccus sp. SDUM812002]MDQ8187017.1 DUF58 domain-containing protein [Pelagicoccus sp. SDUM812002]